MILCPGLSIECNGRRGTLGAFVTSRHFPDELFLLSAYHVLDDGDGRSEVRLPDHANALVAVYQPGVNATFALQDAAIARVVLRDPFNMFSNEVPTGTFAVERLGAPAIAETLVKYGAGSGETTCTVADIFDDFENGRGIIELGRATTGPVRYAAGGDSGAMWCNQRNHRAIAIHIQGGRPGNMALASPVVVIFQTLGLAFARSVPTAAGRSVQHDRVSSVTVLGSAVISRRDKRAKNASKASKRTSKVARAKGRKPAANKAAGKRQTRRRLVGG